MGYLYKLIDLRSLTPSLSVLNVADPQKVAFERAGKIPWIHVSGDTTHREFFVNAGEYLFALRAVDALGGVEPFLEFRGNEGAQGNAFLTLASPHTEVLECDKAKLGEDRYWYNTLVAARAWNPASPALPDLEVDGDKVGPNWRNEGVPLTEAVIAPILSAGAEGFPGKLDCLYAYEAAGTVRDPDNRRPGRSTPGTGVDQPLRSPIRSRTARNRGSCSRQSFGSSFAKAMTRAHRADRRR